MKARILLILFVLTSCALTALAQNDNLTIVVNIQGSGFIVESDGSVEYSCNLCLGAGYITGTHSIADGGAGTVASAQFGPHISQDSSIYLTHYSATVSASTVYEHCYRASLSATGEYGASNRLTSGMYCAPPKPPPPPPPPPPDPPADTGPGGGCMTNCETGTENALGAGGGDPILFKLGSGPWKLSGLNDPVLFDINNTGHLDTVGWTAADSEIAFLAIDRNGNGRIDDGGELFGNGTLLTSGSRAPNGFEALAEFDANGDGVIDQKDPVWSRLLLWTDRSHDGVSQAGELQPIATSPVTSIDLDHHWTGRRDPSGNAFCFESHLKQGHRTQAFYDVFFAH
jgi:hypothetical protein